MRVSEAPCCVGRVSVLCGPSLSTGFCDPNSSRGARLSSNPNQGGSDAHIADVRIATCGIDVELRRWLPLCKSTLIYPKWTWTKHCIATPVCAKYLHSCPPVHLANWCFLKGNVRFVKFRSRISNNGPILLVSI